MLLKPIFALFACAPLFICSVRAADDTKQFEEMKSLAAKAPKGLINLTGSEFENLISKSTSFNSVVLFTASNPKYGCASCPDAVKKMEAMSEHNKRFGNSDKIYFIKLEPENAIDIFKAFKMLSPPKVLFFPATDNVNGDTPKRIAQIDIGPNVKASEIAAKLKKLTGIKVHALEPVDHLKMTAYFLLACVVYTIYTMIRQNKLTIFKFLYGLSSALLLAAVLMMTSGFLWNKLKNPGQGAGGSSIASHFSNNLQNQYSKEPIFVSSCYGIAASSFIFLIKRAPAIDNKFIRSIVTILCLATVVLASSYLFMFFKIKSPSYPYKLLL
ncbi:hypothetical protein BB561_003664 [Smittium simulii]|uniref:Uncharacterized protein n=1 Tax=Smittium simulii TaxID=133385 RepID=A0A2T9YK54_9FUNG|nr:hypothetical protein BB561_003664 [Smittium simulii]